MYCRKDEDSPEATTTYRSEERLTLGCVPLNQIEGAREGEPTDVGVGKDFAEKKPRKKKSRTLSGKGE